MATTTKKPTAAELARREAQSKADTGETKEVTVTVDGVTVTLDEDIMDDYDNVAALQNGNPQPFLEAFFPDFEEREKALNVLRDEKGKLRLSRVIEWVGGVFKAAGQGNS